MQPNELLSYYSIVIPEYDERYKLNYELQTSNIDQKNQLEQRIEALSMIESIPREVSEFYTEMLFVIASYLVEGYESHQFTSEFTVQFLEVVKKNEHFQSFPKTVSLLHKVTEPGITFAKWDWYNRHPDTKQAYSPDDERKYLLFYCLNGISVLAHQPDIGPLPIHDIQTRLPRLKEICTQIVHSSSAWGAILGIDTKQIEKLAGDFINANQRIFDAWKTNREEQIIKADLDPNKTDTFAKKVVSTIEATQGLTSLLKHYGCINIAQKSLAN